MNLCAKEYSITKLKGIGEKTSDLFKKLEIRTIEDLFLYYPKSYELLSEPVCVSSFYSGERYACLGIAVEDAKIVRIKNSVIVSLPFKDKSGCVFYARWFGMPYIKKSFYAGKTVVLYGRVSKRGESFFFEQPEVFNPKDYEKEKKTLRPVYSLVKGITSGSIEKYIKQAFSDGYVPSEILSPSICKKYGFSDKKTDIWNIHFPKDTDTLTRSRKRLVFEEFYIFLRKVKAMKLSSKSKVSPFTVRADNRTDRLISSLPFSLTKAQKRVFEEIRLEMSSGKVVNRLIQGDVGSGKTIVAFLLMYEVALSSYQAALMAPTEILSIQHFEKLRKLNDEYSLGLNIVLITGSQKLSEKKEAYQKIATHQADIVIGTHALIQDKVEFSCLALVITDEQHRFGVRQRELLNKKGVLPHTVVMSATPIPRTLAIILYGDLDISVIDEMPANRKEIKNCIITPDKRKTAYDFICQQIMSGHQAYIVCPLIEKSSFSDYEDVKSYTEGLKKVFPKGTGISFIHGKMRQEEKDSIMNEFFEGKTDILVSTTVIEVGIDVNNATVMMIENADKYGLSQLHQLRGRIGRGNLQSFCIFVDCKNKEEPCSRLKTLLKSNDGFFIASEDLKSRGPGDFFGIKQSGLFKFRLGDIFTDASVLADAKKAVEEESTANDNLKDCIINDIRVNL